MNIPVFPRQELSDRLAGGPPKRPTAAPKSSATAGPGDAAASPNDSPNNSQSSDTPAEPISEIEKTLQEKSVGPALPDLPTEEDDLFD